MDSPQPNPSQPPVLGQKDLGHPSNGDVISVLETLPKDRPFGVVDDNLKLEFLRQLYVPLRRLFGTTTSRSKANIHRVQSINQLEVLQKLRDRFPQFKKDPFEFWERSVEALPQYSGQGKLDRARTFLEGAVQLDTNIDEQRILQRFVAVSAYKLFRRAIPTSESRVLVTSVKRFLVHTGLSVSNCDIETYSNIIRRGQRYTNFCRQLAAGHIGDGDLVNGEEHNEIYGTLFFLSIPDSM